MILVQCNAVVLITHRCEVQEAVCVCVCACVLVLVCKSNVLSKRHRSLFVILGVLWTECRLKLFKCGTPFFSFKLHPLLLFLFLSYLRLELTAHRQSLNLPQTHFNYVSHMFTTLKLMHCYCCSRAKHF